MAETYDVIVIGGGAAGENAAGRCAAAGLEVALVEEGLVGGECSYWACMPSKALLRPGEVLAAARRVPGARAAVTGDLDATAALARRDAVVRDYDDRDQVRWVDSVGARLVRGHARLAGERVVEVHPAGEGAPRRLEARRAVVLATGSAPVVPAVEGLHEIRRWTSRDVTAAKEVPRRLLVLGGGVVGVEMAQAWHRLGAQETTIVQSDERLLPREEPFAGEQLEAAFEAEGIRVLTGAQLARVERAGRDGPITATLRAGGEIVADEILVAVGRRPRTADVGLDAVGLTPGEAVEVDARLRATGVSGGWLYAVGDINGRAPFTHMGKYQARLAGDAIAGRDVADVADERAVPRVVFTDPQVAAVGRTEQAAAAGGIEVRTVSCDFADVAAATVLGESTAGSAFLVVDRRREVVVGATFTGPGAGELLHAATIAVVGEVPLGRLWHAVPSFPTLSELWLRLLERYGL